MHNMKDLLAYTTSFSTIGVPSSQFLRRQQQMNCNLICLHLKFKPTFQKLSKGILSNTSIFPSPIPAQSAYPIYMLLTLDMFDLTRLIHSLSLS